MDFFDVIYKRRSIRKYKNKPVEWEKVKKIIDSARVAPSARHRQPWRYIVITDPEMKERVYKSAREQKFILEAPVLIACVGYPADYVCTNGNIAHQVDIGIAGEHIALSATALGLGSCWVAAFQQREMKEILNVPEDAHIVALFTIGYPDEEPKPKTRKSLDEITVENDWTGEVPKWIK
ncbi:nitroreductase [bacterium]|nr:MAG: nitroreductase [bacterium]